MSLSEYLQQCHKLLSNSSFDVNQVNMLLLNVRSCLPGSLATFQKDEVRKAALLEGDIVGSLKKFFAVVIPGTYGKNATLLRENIDLDRITGMMANITDVSQDLCKEVMDSGLYKDLFKYLDTCVEPNARSTTESMCTIWFWCTLGNILVCIDCRNQYRECDAIAIACKYRNSNSSEMKFLVEGILASVVDEAEVDKIYQDNAVIKLLLKYLETSLSTGQHRTIIGAHLSARTVDVVMPLNQLCTNKANLNRLIENGILKLYIRLIREAVSDEELVGACSGLWMMSFDHLDEVKGIAGLNEELNKLATHKSAKVVEKAKGLLWTLNKEEHHMKVSMLRREASALQIKKGKITADSVPGEHIMMSYQWDHKEKVRKIKQRLEAEGFKVWMDEDRMTGDIMDSMAEAVENSFIVLVGVSRKYKESPNCRAEGKYAFTLRKKIVPLMLEYPYRGDGWLGLITSTELFCKFTKDDDFDKGVEALLGEIRSKLGNQGADTVTAAAKAPTTASPPSASSVHNWSAKDVQEWLNDNSLSACSSNFEDVDGATLMHVKEISEKAPDFFYGEVCQSYGLQGKDKIKFSMLLKKL